MAYFLIVVSNENLQVCRETALAGFPAEREERGKAGPGLWAYCDIRLGDFVSFYRTGAIFDVYRVVNKYVLRSSEEPRFDPGWRRVGGRAFPYRLVLEPVAASLVNGLTVFHPEIDPYARNLMPRQGIGKSHVQFPQRALNDFVLPQCKSSLALIGQRSGPFRNPPDSVCIVPRFVPPGRKAGGDGIRLNEMVLQAMCRSSVGRHLPFEVEEVLSEQALPFGQIDLLGVGTKGEKGLIEIQREGFDDDHVIRIIGYKQRSSRAYAVAIASSFTPARNTVLQSQNIKLLLWRAGWTEPLPFEEASSRLVLKGIG